MKQIQKVSDSKTDNSNFRRTEVAAPPPPFSKCLCRFFLKFFLKLKSYCFLSFYRCMGSIDWAGDYWAVSACSIETAGLASVEGEWRETCLLIVIQISALSQRRKELVGELVYTRQYSQSPQYKSPQNKLLRGRDHSLLVCPVWLISMLCTHGTYTILHHSYI